MMYDNMPCCKVKDEEGAIGQGSSSEVISQRGAVAVGGEPQKQATTLCCRSRALP